MLATKMYVTEPDAPVREALGGLIVDVGSVPQSALHRALDGSCIQSEYFTETSRWLVFVQ